MKRRTVHKGSDEKRNSSWGVLMKRITVHKGSDEKNNSS